MLTKNAFIGVATIGVLGGTALPATAQVAEGSQEIHIYVGEAFGDELTDRMVSGHSPELDDDVTFGVRYGYNFTDAWGLEFSLGRTNTAVTKWGGRDIDFDLTTFDVDGIYHFNSSESLVPYVLAGIGYVNGDLDRPLMGTAPGIGAVRIDDDNAFTFNAGVGAKWFVSDVVSLRLDLRYRYLDKVLDRLDDSLNTFETTLGIGFKF
jgi:outer membrane beta-barrel protein